MTQFTTITDLEILNNAYMCILAKWAHEDELCCKTVKAKKPNQIAMLRRDKLKAQLDELHEAIVALENANRTEQG